MNDQPQPRDFKGIWIPKEIWLNDKLNIMEKLMLVEIDSLDNEDGCFASNEYFATFFSLSRNRCSEIIKSLEKKEYITCKYIYKANTKAVEMRVIKCIRNIDWGVRNIDRGYSENREDNNTSINNTINKKDISKDISQKATFESMFEVFWKAYPKHPTTQFSKVNTKRTFLSIVKSHKTYDSVMSALEVWKKSSSWIGGYINNPSKWLKDELWKEEVQLPTKPIVEVKQPKVGKFGAISYDNEDSVAGIVIDCSE